ncbi:Txe/YoeB family addiction module toxin [Parapusillimonas sp. SGNA-6]|uniref:Txe/YoeB family addiction module toxin n=1 Tax=Parapedobacter sp. SGR-10 TaxID=2710879 RepID=UPI0013CF8383|nr:Txe/YoeB family addiction module toxin [Parapedobacter sp. SGR-10]NGF55963.1 Txe/YoeB family addiction module toxin [Parapedobacter sp. SGR-10]NGM90280.1 Txe/YoeB family addiction module toxin [Parapusillimonas sp. SGNA-6]
MEIIYLPKADEDLAYWVKTGNRAVLKKIAELTRAILDKPYSGIGKPEALKYNLAPKWSRRITKEHRYIYHVQEDKLYVYSLRGHYE